MTILRNLITVLAMSVPALSAVAASSILDITEHPADTTIVFPESFETDTHKMMQNWYLQTYAALDKEVDTRPDVTTTDQEIIERLKAIPTTIEMPFNSVVRSYIDMYTGKKRSLVESMLGMSLYYMPIFEIALEREGLPIELKYLPVIESALNPDAVSRVGATGLWQIMLPTARGLGLEVNTLVDERRDPVRSSEAATKYLHQLYDIYKDWSLAIAAYNCGPGNVNKAMARAGEEGKDFWSIYPYLPAETRGYVPCFIAATYVMNNYHKHNISPALAKRPILTDSVHVCHHVHFRQIADVLQIPVEELQILNPQYRQQEIPGHIRPYPLVLPATQTCSYVMSENAILAHDAQNYARRDVVEPSTGLEPRHDVVNGQEGEWITSEDVKYHKVKRKETMASIAKKYGITLSDLKKSNGNISKPRVGQSLKIVTTKRVFKPYEKEPQPDENDNLLVKNPDYSAGEDASADTADNTPMEMPVEMPVVVPMDESSDSVRTAVPDYAPVAENTEAPIPAGDDADNKTDEATEETAADAPEATSATAGKVADTFRPSKDKQATAQKEQPAKTNKAESSTAGAKKDSTPAKSTKASTSKKSSGNATHTVKAGDNMYAIARANGTTVEKLQKLNPHIKNNKIKPGDKIRLK